MSRLRAPFSWMGGKYYQARRILAAFPAEERYDTYVEPFGGAAQVLLLKPPGNHYEVYNDLDGDLVNFWIQCRDHAGALQARLATLPYSRQLYYDFHQSLFNGTPLSSLERAVRWFYVLRSSFRAEVRRTRNGWKNGAESPGIGHAHSYLHAVELFSVLATRFRTVEIDHRDACSLITQHQSPRTLFYCDPPYVGAEHYYQERWNEADHRRLAALLGATSAYVALSYAPHPLVSSLYPATQWRCLTWSRSLASQRTRSAHDTVQELLLMNYTPSGERLLHNKTGESFF